MLNILIILDLLKKQMVFLAVMFLLSSLLNAQESVSSKKNSPPQVPVFYVTSDNGVPLLHTNKAASIVIQPGDVVTFKAHLPEGSLSEMITWSAGTPSTFSGYTYINGQDELTYTAISVINPSLTRGVDTINVSDGITTITITINIYYQFLGISSCDATKELTVIPDNNGPVSVKPLESFNTEANGGTCNYTWTLIENNSIGATLIRQNQISAKYTAGSQDFSVDVIELSDGISTKRIEVQVNSGKLHGSGNGCFIRNKRSQRD